MQRRKIITGIFGGSFDPLHNGHLALARYIISARDAAGLPLADEVWLSVSPRNPLKNPGATDARTRFRMAQAALAGEKHIKAIDFELSLPLPSYTIDTMRALEARWPDRRFRLIIGADNWLIFRQWRDYLTLARDYSPIVYPRPGYPSPTPDPGIPGHITFLDSAPLTDLSSTQLRTLLADSSEEAYRQLGTLVPKGVAEYIRQHPQLYRSIT